ncbi:MAG: MFS transporter [Acidimicrobiales bacterium]|jgi:EmrB/QacA subfamily drug resistance transporter
MVTASAAVPARATGAGSRWLALSVLCVAVLVVSLDNTILNVALPTLVERLGATTAELQWIVDAYAIAFGGLVLVGGSLADRYGRRRLFILGLVVFGGGSLGAAFSGSVDPLIAWRAVMGVGAAMTVPSALSIVNDVFREAAPRARAIGIWSGTIGLGIAIGPVVGGLLLSRFWWGSVFLVNVPVIVVGILGTLAFVPESRSLAPDRPDPAGSALSILGLGLFLWAIIEAPSRGWLSPEVVGAGLVGLAVLAGFVFWERAIDHPMLPLEFFSSRRFSVAIVSVGLGLFALFGGLFLVTQFLQFFLGYSPLGAGLRILPIAAILALGALISPRVVHVVGSKLVATLALLLVAGGLAQVAVGSTAAATYLGELPGMLLMGLGAGLLIPAAIDSVLGAVTQAGAGVGSATNSTAMQVGGALGIAVLGSVLSTHYRHAMQAVMAGRAVPAVARHAILGSIGGALAVARIAGGVVGAELAEAARVGYASGSRTALIVGAAVTGAGALIALVALPSRPPAEGPSRPPGK